MTFRIGTPHVKGAGYSYNRYSADHKLVEDDVHTCSHCQGVILMREWKEAGGWCGKCEKPLCNRPECVAETNLKGCVPFLKKIDQFLDSTVKFEQHLKIAGLEPPPTPQQIVIP